MIGQRLSWNYVASEAVRCVFIAGPAFQRYKTPNAAEELKHDDDGRSDAHYSIALEAVHYSIGETIQNAADHNATTWELNSDTDFEDSLNLENKQQGLMLSTLLISMVRA